MNKLTRAILLVSAIAFASTTAVNQPAFAQETATKPATGQGDEFQKALDNARLLLRQRRVEEAIAEYRRAAALRDDRCAECSQAIGQINLQLGRFKEAAVALRHCAELKPANEAEIYNVLGVVLYAQNEKELFEQAATAFQRAIELSKGKVVRAYYNLGYALIKAGKEPAGVAALKTYLELDPDSSDASQARAVIANTKMVDARVAPSFAVKSHTGAELSLEKFRGKVVLLDFWASWCGPCRRDIPEIKNILKKFAGEQFVMIGINLDSNRPAFDAYIKEEGITWPQYYDGLGWGNKVSQLYGVYAIPHSVLIDQDGVVKATGLRGAELGAKIGELLATLEKSTTKGPSSK